MTETTTNCVECKNDFTYILKDLRSVKIYCPKCLHEIQKARCKSYKQRNKDKISSYNAMYKAENKESISEYNKKYDSEHREEIQTRQNAYQKNRRATDPEFKFIHAMRTRMNKFMKGQKSSSTAELLGCTRNDFIIWIRYQFIGNMEWNNHGSVWHYDHVIPCAIFDQTNADEQEKCWHWSNYRPMFGPDNMSKQDKISKETIKEHINTINAFIEEYNDEISDEMTLLNYDRVDYANC